VLGVLGVLVTCLWCGCVCVEPEPVPVPEPVWPCSACTYENAVHCGRCGMCATEKPAPGVTENVVTVPHSGAVHTAPLQSTATAALLQQEQTQPQLCRRAVPATGVCVCVCVVVKCLSLTIYLLVYSTSISIYTYIYTHTHTHTHTHTYTSIPHHFSGWGTLP